LSAWTGSAAWPIAIEAQLYVLLPLLLLVRRVSARAMVGLVAAIVVTIGLLGSHVPLMNSVLVKFTPTSRCCSPPVCWPPGPSPPVSTPGPVLGRLRAGRHGAGHRVDSGQVRRVAEPQSVLARLRCDR
jgi:hypothetical protein